MKDISELIPDVREALQEGWKNLCRRSRPSCAPRPVLGRHLRRQLDCPAGQSRHQADHPDDAQRGSQPQAPPNCPITGRAGPAPAPNLGGYTLGNRTTYRIYAMDLAPSGVWGNIYRGETRRQTSLRAGWKVLVHPLYQ